MIYFTYSIEITTIQLAITLSTHDIYLLTILYKLRLIIG